VDAKPILAQRLLVIVKCKVLAYAVQIVAVKMMFAKMQNIKVN